MDRLWFRANRFNGLGAFTLDPNLIDAINNTANTANTASKLTSTLTTISNIADTAGKVGTSIANVYQAFQKPGVTSPLPGTYNAYLPNSPALPPPDPRERKAGFSLDFENMSLPVKLGLGAGVALLAYKAFK